MLPNLPATEHEIRDRLNTSGKNGAGLLKYRRHGGFG